MGPPGPIHPLPDGFEALWHPYRAQALAVIAELCAVPAHRERASLVQRFLAATAGKNTRRLQAETGISQPTIVRLRSGRQSTVKGKTELRIRQFMDATVVTSKPE